MPSKRTSAVYLSPHLRIRSSTDSFVPESINLCRGSLVSNWLKSMKLYDAYGREVDTAELRDEQAAPTMAGVRNIYSMMHPSVGLTPEKLIAIQREAEAGDPYLYLELAEEMEEKDLHYLAVIGTRKQAVAGAELIVT